MASGPQQEDGETLSEVNVIPLADLSLVLLIILMVISPMIMQSLIKVHSTAAQAVKSKGEEAEPPLVLTINPDGLVLNSIKITDDLDLAKRLSVALENREEKIVMISADPAVAHGRVVSVLDLVKQKGATKIALLKKAK